MAQVKAQLDILALLVRVQIRAADKEPVINIPKWIWHERLGFIVPPLPVNNELVLVVAWR